MQTRAAFDVADKNDLMSRTRVKFDFPDLILRRRATFEVADKSDVDVAGKTDFDVGTRAI